MYVSGEIVKRKEAVRVEVLALDANPMNSTHKLHRTYVI
jgi:hypothetical protein